MAIKFLFSGESGVLIDEAAAPLPLTLSASHTVSDAQSKYGTRSVYMPDEGGKVFYFQPTFGELNKVAAVTSGANLTLEAWVYFAVANAVYDPAILEIYKDDFSYLRITNVANDVIGTDREFFAQAGGPSGEAVHDPVTLAAGAWHHLALVMSGGQSTFYANGARVSASAANVGSWSEDPFNSGTELSSSFRAMYIDEAALHDTALYSGATYTMPGTYSAGPAPVSGLLALAGPLGLAVPRLLAVLPRQARASAPGVLGAARALARHDFTVLLGSANSVYVMDLVTPGGAVRVPISSWQATLQTEGANYVQCVIPACTVWADALDVALEFAIYRRALLPGGEAFEYEMARAPLEQTTFDRGPERNTCTLSGYSPGFAVDTDPPAAYDRALVGVRSLSTGTAGTRARCAVDWLLRPGHRAFADGLPLVVSYINYYAPTGFDSYMDVGSRP